MYEDFIAAIRERKIVIITFYAQDEGRNKTRKCIPFDYGPSRKKGLDERPDLYHFYNLDSPKGSHNLSIQPEQLESLTITDESFDPAEYVNWEPNWYIERDWGEYS